MTAVRLSLEQSIYTSVTSFATQAQSSGISQQVRRQLEARSAYPAGRWTDYAPPLIFRSFPLAPHVVAVVRARFLSSDFTSRDGNFLVHSYVATTAHVQSVRGNVMWLSTQLRCETELPTTTVLPQAEVQCDPDRALAFVPFAIADLSEPGAGRLLTHLLQQLDAWHALPDKDAEPSRVICVGPPGDSFASLEALQSVDGAPSTLPDADVQNVWRLGALFGLLPVMFTEGISFSINEIDAVPGYTLVFKRGADRSALPEAISPYAAWCLDSTAKGRVGDVIELMQWVGTVLRSPSLSALNALSSFHADVVVPMKQNQPVEQSALLAAWTGLAEAPAVQWSPIAGYAATSLAVDGSWQGRAEVATAICRVLSTAGAQDDHVLKAVHLLSNQAPTPADRSRLSQQLPIDLRIQLLGTDLPQVEHGLISQRHAAPPREEGWLRLSELSALYDKLDQSRRAEHRQRLIRVLPRLDDNPYLIDRDLRMTAIRALAEAPSWIAPELRRDLLSDAADALVRIGAGDFFRRSSYTSIRDSLLGYIDQTLSSADFPTQHSAQAADTLREFVDLILMRTSEPDKLKLCVYLMLAAPPRNDIDRARNWNVPRGLFPHAFKLSRAYTELLEIRRGWLSHPFGPFTAHAEWVRFAEPHGGLLWSRELPPLEETAARTFYERVRGVLKELPPLTALAVGTVYGRESWVSLEQDLMRILSHNQAQLGHDWERPIVEIGRSAGTATDVFAAVLEYLDESFQVQAVGWLYEMPMYHSRRPELEAALKLKRVRLARIEHGNERIRNHQGGRR